MSEGLRPHRHEWHEHKIKRYYDEEKHCMVKDVMFRCMICGKIYHERYEYKPPPKKYKSCKSLERNKKKYSNHK